MFNMLFQNVQCTSSTFNHVFEKKEKKSLILFGPCCSAPFIKPAAALWLDSRPVLPVPPIGLPAALFWAIRFSRFLA